MVVDPAEGRQLAAVITWCGPMTVPVHSVRPTLGRSVNTATVECHAQSPADSNTTLLFDPLFSADDSRPVCSAEVGELVEGGESIPPLQANKVETESPRAVFRNNMFVFMSVTSS
jgi:hypothetical protein